MKDFDQNSNDQMNNCYKEDYYLMIVCRSLTPRTSFEASLFPLGLMGQPEGNRFSHYPPAGTLPR